MASLRKTVDYSTFSRNGAPAPAAGIHQPGDTWWKLEGDDLALSLSYTLEHLKETQQQRITQWVISSRLYGNMALVGRAGLSFGVVTAAQPWMKERISWNCVQAATDTVTSRIAKNKPKPLFLTSGGDYKVQRKAKLLNQFTEGVFYENDAYRIGVQAFLDACVWGDGFVHVYAENDRVKYERVMASELWVDELDGFYARPRSMHRGTNIDRRVLIECAREWLRGDSKEFERVEAVIEAADRSRPVNAPIYLADQVEVFESWHLPSGPKADDGKHAIWIKGALLFEEEWENDFFPFARMRWSPRLTGYFSQGLAEQVQNLQLEINQLLQTIKQSFWKGGTFRVFLPTGSKLVKEHITNQIGTTVNYTGDKPPTVVTPALVQPEIFQHLVTLWNKAFEQAGVSQLAASSVKPAGLNSGIAMREYNDIQSDRFMTVGQEYERFFLELARLSIATVKGISKHGSYTVKVPQRDFVKEVDWKEINLDEESYVMKCFPVSSLPQDPAGRMETIEEWVQAGWLTPRQGRRLMDFPDLEMVEGLANAAEDYLTGVLEDAVYDGKPIPAPEPYDDLTLGRELALEFYQRGKVQKVEDEKLDLIRRYLVQLQKLEDDAQAKVIAFQTQAAMQAQQPASPGAAPAGPMPRPQSPLVQNVPAAAA